MKKILLSVLLMLVVFIGKKDVFATTITLEQIASQLNTSNYGAYFMEDTYGFVEPVQIDIGATILEDDLLINGIITLNSEPIQTIESSITWSLNENILSITLDLLEGIDLDISGEIDALEVDGMDPEDLNDLIEAIMQMILKSSMLMAVIDTIGQLNDYAMGETIERLNIMESDIGLSLSIEQNGIEMEQPNEDSITVNLDLSKQLVIPQEVLNNNDNNQVEEELNDTDNQENNIEENSNTNNIINTENTIPNPQTGPVSLNSFITISVLLLSIVIYFITSQKNKFKNI